MKNATTADRLKYIMQERNLKQVDILNLCKPFEKRYGIKINKNDLSQYVNGKNSPGQFKLTILAKALNVDETWLMGFDTPMNREHIFDYSSIPGIEPLPKTKNIPLLGSIACGEPILAEQNIEFYLRADENIKADFALRCKGDSMINARIFDGDIVYIHSQPTVENGEIAAVLIGNEATLKKAHHFNNKIVLSPCNPMYENIIYENEQLSDVRILGKAIYFVSEIR